MISIKTENGYMALEIVSKYTTYTRKLPKCSLHELMQIIEYELKKNGCYSFNNEEKPLTLSR